MFDLRCKTKAQSIYPENIQVIRQGHIIPLDYLSDYTRDMAMKQSNLDNYVRSILEKRLKY